MGITEPAALWYRISVPYSDCVSNSYDTTSSCDSIGEKLRRARWQAFIIGSPHGDYLTPGRAWFVAPSAEQT